MSQTKKAIYLAIAVLVFWLIITLSAKSDIRDISVDLTWDTVAPEIATYNKRSLELTEAIQIVPEYSNIVETINVIIHADNIVKVVMYTPSQEINTDSMVLVFLANRNPREITRFDTTEIVGEWRYSAFTIKDGKGDKYSLIIVSKDTNRISEIEKAIMRLT